MSDLISRLDIKYHTQLEAMGNGQYEAVEVAYKNDIESLPSADAVEVVRCKDCKHRDPEDKKCDCGMWHFPYITDDNDYCSYGERREP